MFSKTCRITPRGRFDRKARRGAVAVLAAFLMTAMIAMLAFAVDLGYLLVEKCELQRSADAAALAAAWELADEGYFKGDANLTEAIDDARSVAKDFAARNIVGSINPLVDLNSANLPDGDVVIGYMATWNDPYAPLDTSDPSKFNAVRVRVHRSAIRNGFVPSFFARVLGVDGFSAQGQATAALASNIVGFRAPPDGSNLGMLPFALDINTWNDMLAGLTPDQWSWNEDTQTRTGSGDDIHEGILYPDGTTPGNFGTIDIGGSNNSTADIARQILDGLSPEDLAHVGGEVKLDPVTGELDLNGDTGISAGISSELASIIGAPRILPIYDQVVGPGNNATFTIVKFVGVRILDVKLNGGNKRVVIQPAPVVTKGAIYDDGSSGTSSSMVFTPVRLVQ